MIDKPTSVWTVGHFKAANIPPKDVELIEGLIALGNLVRDENGKYVRVNLPPALVYAIVEMMRSPFPPGAVRHWVNEFTPPPQPKSAPAPKKRAAPKKAAPRRRTRT